jgi:hypothetical protein
MGGNPAASKILTKGPDYLQQQQAVGRLCGEGFSTTFNNAVSDGIIVSSKQPAE